MTTRNITYGKLEKILIDRGFTRAGQKGTHLVFGHKDIDSIVVLPAYSRPVAVKPVHVIAVKRALVDNGLMKTEEFEKVLNSIIRPIRAKKIRLKNIIKR